MSAPILGFQNAKEVHPAPRGTSACFCGSYTASEYNCTHSWRFPLAQDLVPTRFRHLWAQVEWERCIEPEMCGLHET
jgi:hypothetical protein